MATPYKVGDLEVSIKAISNNALASLDGVINRMTSLSSILKTITASDMKWITSLGTRMKTLSKNMASVDWKSLEDGFSRLTVAITPFLNKITSAQASLQALNATIDKLNTKKFANLVGGGKTTKQNNATGRSFFAFGKLATTFYIARRLAGVMADIVQYGVDYTETLNLWQVAMRDNLSMATQFVNKMSKAYGISQKTLMQAQATFRNMIGSLGDLSDSTSYALSEAITQMAIDYSSLYNAPIEEAINKFQSALAGQVRPIRSISGYDITEKTIQALYEALGGTKTQRQLSRTEKQLLAIYAIFNQMEKSGALGDMTKTLDNFANQSRMMTENWKEFVTWFGTVITYLLQKSEIMIKINAALITGANVMKALAFSIGYETPNFAAGWENSVDNTITAVDELQGKLLGFDKIRAMNTEQDEISIDEKLLQAISGYSSLIDQANNKAAQLAETWTSWWVDDEGNLTEEAERLISVLKAIGIVLGGLMAYNLTTKIGRIAGLVTGLTSATKLLNGVLVVGIIATFSRMIELFDEGNYVGGILAGLMGVTLVFAFLELNNKALLTVWQTIGKKLIPILFNLKEVAAVTASSVVSFGLAFMGAWAILKLLPENAQKLVGGIMAIAGAFIALTTAILAYKGVVTWGAALPVLSAAVGAALAGGLAWKGQIENISKYANGGTPDKGTLFIAGEAGAEIVATSSNGQTGVSNVQQIEQAFYNALVRYGGGESGGEVIVVKVGEDEVFRASRRGANKRGLDFARKG